MTTASTPLVEAIETVSDVFEVEDRANSNIQFLLRKYNPHFSTLEALHCIEVLYINSDDPKVTTVQSKRYIASISDISATAFQKLRKAFCEQGSDSEIGRAAAIYGYLVSKRWTGDKWILVVDKQRVPPYYMQEGEVCPVASYDPEDELLADDSAEAELDIEAVDAFEGLSDSQDEDDPYCDWLKGVF